MLENASDPELAQLLMSPLLLSGKEVSVISRCQDLKKIQPTGNPAIAIIPSSSENLRYRPPLCDRCENWLKTKMSAPTFMSDPEWPEEIVGFRDTRHEQRIFPRSHIARKSDGILCDTHVIPPQAFLPDP